jgi:ferritin
VTLTNGHDSIRAALALEREFTKHIHTIAKVCGSDEDFHAADWITTQLLDEQLKGVRQLTGMANELAGLKAENPILGEWIYDQQLGKAKRMIK